VGVVPAPTFFSPVYSVTTLFTSRKSLRALIGTIAIAGGLWLMWSTYTTPETRAAAFIGAVYGVQKLWAADIDGIATEDAARTASPASQVNVGSTVDNTAPAPTPAPVEPTPPPKPVAVAKPSGAEILAAALNKLSDKIDRLPTAPPAVVQAPPAAHETSA
jgi:hypothetical protein